MMCSQSPGAVSQFQHNSLRHLYQTISCALVPPYITQGRCLFHNPYPQYGDRRSIHEYLRSTSVQGRGIWSDRYQRPPSRFRGYQNYLTMWYLAVARNVAQKPLPRRSSSNAYNVKDADAALESFNPVRKAQSQI